MAGLVRALEQAGSAAMLIVFGFGAAPSSFTVPVTSPAVAGSTIFPAGALVAGAAELSVDSCLFPPHPVIAIANAPTASEYIPNLVFLTKQFLLFEYKNFIIPMKNRESLLPCTARAAARRRPAHESALLLRRQFEHVTHQEIGLI